MNGQADAVKGPAIGLIVTAGVGALLQVISLLANMFSGGLGIVLNIVGLAVAGLIVYGAMQMMKLQKYGLSMAATIAAMVPCISPCCILGLPLGIWALVVLMKPEVKAAFVG